MVLLVSFVQSTVLLVNWLGLVGDSLQVGDSKLLSYLVCYTYSLDVIFALPVDDVVSDPTDSDWMVLVT